MHAWLRIVVPLTRPFEEKRGLLPILYQPSNAGSDRQTVVESEINIEEDNAVAGEHNFGIAQRSCFV